MIHLIRFLGSHGNIQIGQSVISDFEFSLKQDEMEQKIVGGSQKSMLHVWQHEQ